MTEMLTKQHEMERSDLTHRLKLEQDEEVEKLRKVCPKKILLLLF